ncbi:hypothetical protein SAMN05444920_102747 [Nonomuraea solani]|uniref:Uncharacterized protein n=1 Tax=Nonomuraea solani TaxID=1144553 RepID=A0A1H5ZNR3_9ACTN|nr:hypothetical protein [Nonomuraea solani]SEG37036.1 hypothetical protein SAMN05444920_102747 [Nonomuraea solani]
MYRTAVAAVTMTAAALLLATTPALAYNDDDDHQGPFYTMCEGELHGLIKLHAPVLVWWGDADCATDTDDIFMAHLDD